MGHLWVLANWRRIQSEQNVCSQHVASIGAVAKSLQMWHRNDWSSSFSPGTWVVSQSDGSVTTGAAFFLAIVVIVVGGRFACRFPLLLLLIFLVGGGLCR